MERYKKLGRCGEGTHGVVFKAQVLDPYEQENHENLGQSSKGKRKNHAVAEEEKLEFVAIKKIRLKSKEEGLSLEAIREIKLLREFEHPNIVKVHGMFSHHSNVNIVMDFMGHDLDELIRHKEIKFSLGDVKQFMRMALLGVEYVHARFVLHRDIKPANLLIGSDCCLKLADFGLAKAFGSPDKELSNQGTLNYRAPELIFGDKFYGTGADMWSLGCIFAELLTREVLFPGTGELNQLSVIFDTLGTPTEEDWPNMTQLPQYTPREFQECSPFSELFPGNDEDTLDLLQQMLRFDPNKRISASEALKHPFFSRGPVPTPPHELPQIPEKKTKPVRAVVKRLSLPANRCLYT